MMKHKEKMLSKKFIINDLLCFIQNNLDVLGSSSTHQLCEETYMPDEVSKAYQDLKENVQLFDSMFDFENSCASKKDFLKRIINVFESKACDSLKFASCNFNMPKMNTYRDILSVTCVLNEVKELKRMMLEQTQFLTTSFCHLSNQFEQLKQNGITKVKPHSDSNEPTDISQRNFSNKKPFISECMKNGSSTVDPSVSASNSAIDTNLDLLPFPSSNSEDMLPMESSLEVVSQFSSPSTGDLNTDHLRCSLKRLSSSGKYYKKHSCKLCGYIGNLTDVTRHMRTHTGERPFACPFCSTKFTLRGNMIKHLARKHGAFLSRLPSTTKGKKYSSQKTRRKNDRSNHEPVDNNAVLSEPSSTATLEIENKLDSEASSPVMSNLFADPEIIEVKPEIVNESFTASSFGADLSDSDSVLIKSPFPVSSSLINDMTQASSAVATYNPMLHMQSTHHEDAPAASMQALDRFVNNQMQKKRHQCEICGYTGNASDVTRHKRTHTGERPYPCPVCSARFSLRGNMTKHLVRMHPGYDEK